MEEVKLMEHIKFNKSFKHFVLPPPFPTSEEIALYRDGLIKITTYKLEDLLARIDVLKRQTDEALVFVREKIKPGSDEEWFLTLLAEHEFSEAYVVQKWIKYWLEIWWGTTNHTHYLRLREPNKFDDYEIVKAKESPIENLYEGQLKPSGNKLVGLCPFHKEKTPSFYIFNDNKAKCFGCGWFGDSIKFVIDQIGLTFPEAVRYLL